MDIDKLLAQIKAATAAGHTELIELALVAMNNHDVRAVVGLPKLKGLNREYRHEDYGLNSDELNVFYRYHIKEIKQVQAVEELASYVGLTLDRKTFLKLYKQVLPRIEASEWLLAYANESLKKVGK